MSLLILGTGVAIVSLAVLQPDPAEVPPLAQATPSAAAPSSSAPATSGGGTRIIGRGSTTIGPDGTVTLPGRDGARVQLPGMLSDSAAGSTNQVAQGGSISNPAPWQYDPKTDRYWHAEHGHWHPGKPPAESTNTPDPWQYDPATNKHWHPGHGHWHDGQPPPPDQRKP